jgi:hypothetical protein
MVLCTLNCNFVELFIMHSIQEEIKNEMKKSIRRFKQLLTKCSILNITCCFDIISYKEQNILAFI